ncbi:RTA1 like protein-domain-containing protein [Cercophora scortea]|uniref:RTA1 like protein-domain-containing protein n=1 Tax=Cercophora scortea TaxID=314031 RepID=A0AAE0ILX1_9PEZI|nr:RTA1 like protein-domain-containing protein [Cercophora scortea]
MNSSDSPPPPGVDPVLWDQILHLHEGCLPFLIDILPNSYTYWPNFGAGLTFSILFFLATVGHLLRYAHFRRWTSPLLALGALIETTGWASRTWSSKCPYNQTAFLIQITTLIIAPTFFAAAIYLFLNQLTTHFDLQPQFQPQPQQTPTPNQPPATKPLLLLPPRLYATVFCTCDIISLTIQAVGGALASRAAADATDTQPGTRTMVAGIAFQLATMSLFALLAGAFLLRVMRDMKSNNTTLINSMTHEVKLTLLSIGLAFVAIYVRSVYRTIELAQGWEGYLITREGYFIGLDAALMFVAVGVLLVFDPIVLLSTRETRGDTVPGGGGTSNVYDSMSSEPKQTGRGVSVEG